MAQTSTLESVTNNLNSDVSDTKAPEGKLTRTIESQTAKIPSVGYLGLAVGSIVLSAGLAIFSERKTMANFVGLWVPTFLLFGIYNKMVKLQGSDYSDNGQQQDFSSSARSA